MQQPDLYSEFGCLLSSTEAAQVLAGLRQDPVVWKSLENDQLWQAAVRYAGGQVSRWTPGMLGLMAVGCKRTPEELAAQPMVALEAGLHEMVLQAYQNAQAGSAHPAGGVSALQEAALLALALRERRRLTESWDRLLPEIQARTGQGSPFPPIWRAAVTCLMSLVPDPQDLLRALLPANGSRATYEWVTHAQLSQPVANREHVQVFTHLLQGQPLTIQLGTLRSLTLHGREELAEMLAEALLVGHPSLARLRNTGSLGDLDLPGIAARALTLQQLGALYQLSGNRSQAQSMLRTAEQTLKHWIAGLYLQEIHLDTCGDPAGFMDDQKLAVVVRDGGKIKGELGAVMSTQVCLDEQLEQLQADRNDPFLQIRMACQVAEDGNLVLAQDIGRQGVAALLETLARTAQPFNGEFVFSWNPIRLIESIQKLGMVQEALQVGHVLHDLRPTDTALMKHMSIAYETEGDLAMACRFAQAAASHEPHKAEWRRRLGKLRFDMNEWPAAFVELEMALALSNPPQLEDRLAFAQAALQIHAYPRVIETCEVILNETPENGLAAGLMGQALAEMGEEKEAMVFLSRATLLAPENLAPWLVMAAMQQKQGETARALETLRGAVIAAPQAVEGHLALSQACLEEGLLSEALPHLKQAFLLKPNSDQTSFLYGKTLRTLGHAGEARSVLERTRGFWMRRPEMAYEYALAALDLQDGESALPALEVALRAPEPPVAWYLLFARVLLNEMDSADTETSEAVESPVHEMRCRQAEQALDRVLDLDPDNVEACFLLANLRLERNQLDEALEMFSNLSEMDLEQFTELQWRIQWGMGRAALRLGKIDMALASLQEAAQRHPDHLELQRSLAEASLHARLGREAQAAAEYALQLAPDRVDNLVWFAEVMIALNERDRAAEALGCAIELDPDQADLRIRLAWLEVSSGNMAAANVCLAALADMKEVSSVDLRRAAHTYLRMENPGSALACLERSLEVDAANQVQTPMEVLYETARLHEQADHKEKSLELTQRALSNAADAARLESLPVFLMQADLLARLGRSQAALASLEKSLLVLPAETDETALDAGLKQTLNQIHQAFTLRLMEAGNLPAALEHAKQALALVPDCLSFRCLAGQLAINMLQMDRAAKMVAQEELPAGDSPDALTLRALRMELALYNGGEAEARQQLAEALVLAPTNPRFLALQARLAAADGDLQAAQRHYQEVSTQAGDSVQPALWRAEAALAAQHWAEAIEQFEAYLQSNPDEALAYLSLARALVVNAEQQRICELLHCTSNMPGAAATGEAAYLRLNEVLTDLGERSSTSEMRRWQARGQAAFQPSLQAARSLIAYLNTPEDAAALVAVLRQQKNIAGALQTAHRHPLDARVQLQLGLCYLGMPETSTEDAPEESQANQGLLVAAELANRFPGQPLHHALLAALARQAGVMEQALEAYETALQYWPDEAAWHDAAGDLAIELGRKDTGLVHREQSWTLDQGSVRAAMKLGHVCIEEGKVDRAVYVLEKASQLGNDQADVWLLLARAYLKAGRLPQAYEAALLSTEIDHLSARGFLLAGETALAMDQLGDACDLGRSAVQREPENPEAYLFLCRVLDLKNQPREALEALEQASPAVRQNFSVAFERARLIRDLHGPQAALETLERLAQDFPDEPDLLAFLSRTLAECGDMRMAERHAFKALRLNPNQPDLALMLGRLQRKSGQLDQSVHLLSEAVRMAPGQLDAYLELGSVYQDRREFDQALQVYRQAIRVAPRDYQAYYQSGLILRDSKDYAGSEHMLRQAADLAPDNPSIRRQLIAVITLNLVHKK